MRIEVEVEAPATRVVRDRAAPRVRATMEGEKRVEPE
jgi:hypothetical protein